jgi:DNA-binding response OmpR family regulator
MKILVAEDDPVSSYLLTIRLTEWGHEVVCVSNGVQARDVLCRSEAPRLALIDWMMPAMDGLEVCQTIRQQLKRDPPYLILLTSRNAPEDVVKGIEAGADDYVVKSFHDQELKVRIEAGIRILQLQTSLQQRVQELEDALAKVNLLQGLLPICSYCKSIRDDRDYWHQLETFISDHTDARFTHGICPACYEQHVQPELDRAKATISAGS